MNTINKPIINKFSKITPLKIHKYERYLPTAFDESLTLLEKINKVIHQLDKIGLISNDVIEQWNNVMEWVINDGLSSTISDKLNQLIEDGTIADIINIDILDSKADKQLVENIKISLEEAIDSLNITLSESLNTVENKINDLGTFIERSNGLDMTTIIQSVLDMMPDGSTIRFPAGTYIVSKNTALTGFPKGDQPCLLIRGKKNIRIVADGVKLKVNTHAQGILEIQQSENIIIEGLITEGYGEQVPIDGDTGIGEKGNASQGYHTSGFWNYNKNNSNDTSGDTRHGNNGQPWGTFGGGFIGNVGSGILIQNACKNIVLYRCESFGFNYSGIHVGHWGDDETYPASEDILIDSCYVHDNYSSNVGVSKCVGFKMINCVSENAGHPDAKPLTDVQPNPGYGVTLAGGLHAMCKQANISNNIFRGNIRKGIDVHAGENIVIQGNQVYDSYYQGIFATWSSPEQYVNNVIISDNILERCGHRGSALFVRGSIDPNYSEDNVKMNTIVKGNIIKESGGGSNNALVQMTTFGNLNVSDNLIEGVRNEYTGDAMTGIMIGRTSTPTLDSFALQLNNNTVIDKTGKVFVGIQLSDVVEGVVSGNIVKLESDRQGFGIYSISCDDVIYVNNVARIKVGTPLNINQTTGHSSGNVGVGGTIENLEGDNPVSVAGFKRLRVNEIKTLKPTVVGNQQVLSMDVPNQFIGLVNDSSGRWLLFSSITKDTIVEISSYGFGLFANTVLTGTTGDAGKCNVGKKDGKLYFENYTGSNKTFAMTIL